MQGICDFSGAYLSESAGGHKQPTLSSLTQKLSDPQAEEAKTQSLKKSWQHKFNFNMANWSAEHNVFLIKVCILFGMLCALGAAAKCYQDISTLAKQNSGERKK